MQYVDMWLTNNRPGRKINARGVVIHWTGNTGRGANAKANRNYFQNNPQAQVSAHYIVDDTYIVRCIPEEEVAWHCGGTKYTALKQQLFGSASPNNYLLGIEMCVNSDGNWEKTYGNTVQLVADILIRLKWDTSKIYRHYDITGKDCPRMMTPFVSGGEDTFKKFKQDVEKVIGVTGMFKDLVNHWGKNDIEWLAERGIVKGKDKDNFKPNDLATRAEVAIFIKRAIDYMLEEIKK